MDQTDVQFDMVSNYTLEHRGLRSVHVKSNGSWLRCTVLLACSLSGNKLDPLIVFKGASDGTIAKQLISIEKLQEKGHPLKNMTFMTHPKAWCDTNVMQYCIATCLRSYCTTKEKKQQTLC